VEVEELVVTAHRVPIPRDALTGSVTVLDREEIRASGADHVQELLRTVPGASVARSGSWGDPTSLFLRGGESDFVKVLVDGIAVNRPGGAFDFSTLTLDNVQRIEIVRGPSSVVHGSDAVTGVVQIFTRTGTGPPTLSTGGDAGTYGTLDWDASVSGGGEEARYAFSLSRLVTDGPLAFNDDHRSTVASGRVDWSPGPRTDASVTVRWTDPETHFPTDASGRVVDRNAVRDGESVLVGAEMGYRLADRLQARARLTLDQEDERVTDRPDGPADTLGAFASRRRVDVGRRGAELRLHYRPGPGTVVTAGAEVENEDLVSRSVFTSGFGSTVDSVDVARDATGYFAEVVARPGAWSLSAGARIDHSEAFGTFTTVRAGAGYTLPTGTRLRASAGNSFKEPTFTETVGSALVVGNPGLEPERTRSWEVGVEQELWGDRASVAVTWFDQDFRDLVQFTVAPGDSLAAGRTPAPNFFNVAEAASRGLEVEAEARLPAGLSVRANYSRLDTEVVDAGFQGEPGEIFETGERLLRRPAHTGNLVLAWRPPSGGSVRASLGWLGERDDIAFTGLSGRRTVLDGYTRVDLALRHPIPGLRAAGGVTVTPTLRIDNLLDADYQEVTGFDAPGRTVLAGFRATLGL
jgi:vitamin B12 transporter